jgi:hypothetical protein
MFVASMTHIQPAGRRGANGACYSQLRRSVDVPTFTGVYGVPLRFCVTPWREFGRFSAIALRKSATGYVVALPEDVDLPHGAYVA